jgi:hypothetical protein
VVHERPEEGTGGLQNAEGASEARSSTQRKAANLIHSRTSSINATTTPVEAGFSLSDHRANERLRGVG